MKTPSKAIRREAQALLDYLLTKEASKTTFGLVPIWQLRNLYWEVRRRAGNMVRPQLTTTHRRLMWLVHQQQMLLFRTTLRGDPLWVRDLWGVPSREDEWGQMRPALGRAQVLKDFLLEQGIPESALSIEVHDEDPKGFWPTGRVIIHPEAAESIFMFKSGYPLP
jgi:hypothetical protein